MLQGLMYFSRMEDYAADPGKVVPEIFRFVNEPQPDQWLANQVKNVGVKVKPVHQKTIDLLDDFFQPFNNELAEMLGDDKWRYLRDTS